MVCMMKFLVLVMIVVALTHLAGCAGYDYAGSVDNDIGEVNDNNYGNISNDSLSDIADSDSVRYESGDGFPPSPPIVDDDEDVRTDDLPPMPPPVG